MFIDYSTDECTWCFNTNSIVIVTEETPLFSALKDLMHQQYYFNQNSTLKSYKTDNKTV